MAKHKKYDIFFSHAYKDKLPLANEFIAKLREAGLSVWYSGTDLKGGDDMEEVILQQAIPQSQYFIALISKNYINSVWTRTEFNAAVALETKHKKIIIPVLFNIPFEDVEINFPLHKNHFAIKITDDIDKAVRQIVSACQPKIVKSTKKTSQPSQTPAVNITDAGTVSIGGDINITGKNVAGRDIITNKK